MDCIFCKMVEGEIPTNVVYENDKVFAFRDINPQAPQHILVIPRNHIPTLNDISDSDADVLAEIPLAIKAIAKEQGFDEAGFRVVANCNADGGQTVFHVHFHLLAGRSLSWPPG